MPDITKAYNWAIEKCNDPNVGYSQSYRNQQTVGGVTYYDCSSFIWYALKDGGFDVVGAFERACWGYEGNAIVTAYECDWLKELGFSEINISDEWKPGDVLWRSGHTEMVYKGATGSGRTMGAHSSQYALVDQVSINTNYSSNWSRCFRYEDGASEEPETLSWIYGNRYLSLSEMQNNAKIIYRNLSSRGWSVNAIAATLGNMQQESTINPGIWQSLNSGNTSGGYGLVQWTPSTNYTNWANEHGYSITNGDYQLKWVDEVTVSVGQWIPTSSYNFSFNTYKTSTESVEYLTTAFLKNFERAGSEKLAERLEYANYWYNFIKNLPTGGVEPEQPEVDNTKWVKRTSGFKFVLFNRR